MNRRAPFRSATSIRVCTPLPSTVSSESPSLRDSVELAVQMTVSTPCSAFSRLARSLRSPVTSFAPAACSARAFSDEESRTSAVTGLPAAAGLHHDRRPDAGAVGAGALELHLDPPVGPGIVVAEQRRRLVHVHDQHVDVAVVVEVAEGGPAAGVDRERPRTAAVSEVLE